MTKITKKVLMLMSDVFTTHHVLEDNTKLNLQGSAFLLSIGLVLIPLARIFVGGADIVPAIIYNLASYFIMIVSGMISLRLHPFEKIASDYSKLSRYLFTGYLSVLFLFFFINVVFFQIENMYLVNYLDDLVAVWPDSINGYIKPSTIHLAVIFICASFFVLIFMLRANIHKKGEFNKYRYVLWCIYYVTIITICGYITINGIGIFNQS